MTFQGVIQELNRLKNKINVEVPLEQGGNKLFKNIRNRYGVYPTDGYWAQLAPITRRRKGHNKPLVDTGKLKESQKLYKAVGVREVGGSLDKDIWSEYGVSGSPQTPARPVKGLEAKKANVYFPKMVNDYLSKII